MVGTNIPILKKRKLRRVSDLCKFINLLREKIQARSHSPLHFCFMKKEVIHNFRKNLCLLTLRLQLKDQILSIVF